MKKREKLDESVIYWLMMQSQSLRQYLKTL